MDELLKALAKAVETGSALALPALVGYYLVRALEALSITGSIGLVAWNIRRLVVHVSDNNTKVRLGGGNTAQIDHLHTAAGAEHVAGKI